jgi:phospholipid/cholesterol/gamma-HCH transport system substrate-binding protein
LFADGEEGQDDFANAQWSDSLPALIEAKLLQSFENYDIAHAPLRADNVSEGGLRLVIDIRQFDIGGASAPLASISLSAKLVDASGHLQAARVFEQSAPIDKLTPASAAAAFNRAFEALAWELVLWAAAPQ